MITTVVLYEQSVESLETTSVTDIEVGSGPERDHSIPQAGMPQG